MLAHARGDAGGCRGDRKLGPASGASGAPAGPAGGPEGRRGAPRPRRPPHLPSVLLRLVDDFLVITPSRAAAEALALRLLKGANPAVLGLSQCILCRGSVERPTFQG